MSVTREELIDFLKEAESREDYETANAVLDKIEAMGSDSPKVVQTQSYGEPVQRNGRYQIGGDVPGLGLLGPGATMPSGEDSPRVLAGSAEAVGSSLSAILGRVLGNIASGGQQALSGTGVGQYQQSRNPMPQSAADRVANLFTYQPRTEYGQRLMNTAAEGAAKVAGANVPLTDMTVGELPGAFVEDVMQMPPPEHFLNQQPGVGEDIGSETGVMVSSMYPAALEAGLTAYGAGKAPATYKGKQPPTPKLKETKTGRIEPSLGEMGAIKNALINNTADPRAAKYKLKGGKVVKDEIAVAAGKTGWNDNAIQITKTAGRNEANKMQALRMIDETRKGIKDLEYGASVRPDWIIGNSVIARVNFLKRKLTEAGTKLDPAARQHLGKTKVDTRPFMDSLQAKIGELGGYVDDDGMLQFPPGSGLAGMDANKVVLQKVYDQLNAIGPSASGYLVHKNLKQWIDNFLSEKKMQQGGATGDVERFLGDWRGEINRTLRGVSDEYAQINDQYSAIRESLDNLGKAFGEKRLYGKSAEEMTGQLMRRWIQNNPNRGVLMDAVTEADRIAIEYGGKFSDTMGPQVMMANALNDLIITANPLVRGSLKADVSSAMRAWSQPSHAATEKAVEYVVGKGKQALGYTDDPLKALDALEDLLRTSGQ